jgi:hypothetical protein
MCLPAKGLLLGEGLANFCFVGGDNFFFLVEE